MTDDTYKVFQSENLTPRAFLNAFLPYRKGVSVEEKFKIVNEQNEELRDEVKKLKVKNTFTQIISGALLTSLTVFSIIK